MHTCPSYQSSFSSKPRCASKKLSIGHKIKCEVIILVKNSKKQLKQQHQQQQRQCLILDNMNVNQQVRGVSANNDP